MAQLADLSDLSENGVMNAPYRGGVTAWRESNLEMAYGEVKNVTVRYNMNDISDFEPAGSILGSWDRNVVRVFHGHNCSGKEILPPAFTSRTIGEPDGSSPLNWNWKLSFKVVGTPSIEINEYEISVEYDAEFIDGEVPVFLGDCCPGDFSFPCTPQPYLCNCPSVPPCDIPSLDTKTRSTGNALNVAVAPTSVAHGIGGQHPWYPGTAILGVRAGAASLSATVSESAEMIGQSFLIEPDSGDDFVDLHFYDVRLPGWPETIYVQDKATFDVGTPWPGHAPGYWVDRESADDSIDVVGPDGTIYRFAVEAGEEDPEGVHFLKYVIPPGCAHSSSATATYYYTEYGGHQYLTGIRNGTDGPGAPENIALTREFAPDQPAHVTTVVAGGETWTIGRDTNGWIASVEPPGSKGRRGYEHDPGGRLTRITNADGNSMHEFLYVPSGDFEGNMLSEKSAVEPEGAVVEIASYAYSENEIVQTYKPGLTGGSPDRVITSNYSDKLLTGVAIGSSHTNYTWDEENESGNVVLLEEESADGLILSHGYASGLAGGDTGRGFCGMSAEGPWTLTILDHRGTGTGVVNSWAFDITTITGTSLFTTGNTDANPIKDWKDGASGETKYTIEPELTDPNEEYVIDNIRIELDITHSHRSDLEVRLEHGGHDVLLFYRLGHECCPEDEGSYGCLIGFGGGRIAVIFDDMDPDAGNIHAENGQNGVDIDGVFTTEQNCHDGDLCSGFAGALQASTPFRTRSVLVGAGGEELVVSDTRIRVAEDGKLLRLPQLIATIDGAGQETKIEYVDSEFNRIRSVTGPSVTKPIPTDPSNTEFTYYTAADGGHLANLLAIKKVKIQTNPDVTQVTEYEYDDRRRLIKTTVGIGTADPLVTEFKGFSVPRLRYDGQPELVEDPSGFNTRYEYDAAGRVEKVTTFLTANAVTGGSHETSNTYDLDGWLVHSVTPVKGSAGEDIESQEEQKVEFTRDRVGRLLERRLVRASESELVAAVGFTYNNLDDVIQSTGLDGLFTQSIFDNRGLVTERKYGYGASFGTFESSNLYPRLTETYTYDLVGRLDRVSYVDGRYSDFGGARDAFGRPELTLESPAGAISTLKYDANGNVIEAKVFQGPGEVSSVLTRYDETQRPYYINNEDVHGNGAADSIFVQSFTRNGLVRCTVQRGSNPCSGIINADPSVGFGSIAAIGDVQLGDIASINEYDAIGRMSKMYSTSAAVDCDSGSSAPLTTSYEYDLAENQVVVTHSDGTNSRSIRNKYDTYGQSIESEQLQTGAMREMSYTSLGMPSKMQSFDTTKRGNVELTKTKLQHEVDGRLKSVANVDPANPANMSEIKWSYSPDGRLALVENDAGTTSHTYVDEDLVHLVEDPLGNTRSTKLNQDGFLQEVSVSYPSVGRSSRELKRIFSYGDASGLIYDIRRSADGPKASFAHDIRGALNTYKDRKGATSTSVIDHVNNAIETHQDLNGLNRTVLRESAPQGAVISETHNSGSAEQETVYNVTPTGQRARVVFPDSGNPDSDSFRTTFNAFSEMKSATDPRGRTTGGATLLSATDGHLVTRTMAAGETYAYERDGLGRIVRATLLDPSDQMVNEVEYQYDGLGRLAGETQRIANGSDFTTTYQYNSSGHLIEVGYPDGESLFMGDPVGDAFKPDPLGRPTTITFGTAANNAQLAEYTYDGPNVDTATSFESAGKPVLIVKNLFDSVGRLDVRTWNSFEAGTAAESINSLHRAYDANDNIVAEYSDQPGGSAKYVIDSLNRIIRASRGTANSSNSNFVKGSEVFDFDRGVEDNNAMDLVGNVLQATVKTMTTDGLFNQEIINILSMNDANEIDALLSTVDGIPTPEDFDYDAAGNLIADGEKRYEYDDRYQLTRVTTLTDELLAAYTYDALGRRVTEEIGLAAETLGVLTSGEAAGTKRFVYAGNRVVAEYDFNDPANEFILKRNFWSAEGLDTLLRTDHFEDDTGQVFHSIFYATDAQGSPLSAVVYDDTDDRAVVVERYVYDVHGKMYVTGYGCRRTDIDCDGIVGATDLVLVSSAYIPSGAEGMREDVCGGGVNGDEPDGAINDDDLRCVRVDLGAGVPGLFNADDAQADTALDAYPKPDRAHGLHGLPIDHATGLVYARARHYHPRLGRWTRRDPKGYVDGGNLYEAFRSNSARYVDPMGTLVDEVFNWLINDRFLSNEELDRASDGDSGVAGVSEYKGKLATDISNSFDTVVDIAQIAVDPYGDIDYMAILYIPKGVNEGYRQPAIESMTGRLNSIVTAQVQAGADIDSVSSYTSLSMYTLGDVSGATQLGEALYGVDLASNEMLSTGEAWHRGVQGGSKMVIFGLGPKALKNARARSTYARVAKAESEFAASMAGRSEIHARVMAAIEKSRAANRASQFKEFASRTKNLEPGPNIVYRALNAADAEALASGRGLTAKAPNGDWTALEHVLNAAEESRSALGGAARNSPWISTSRRLDIARRFEGGNGVVAIDLNKVTSLQVEVWRYAPRVNGVEGLAFQRSFWSQEVTIFKEIPYSAIVGPRPR
ncbi:MAG: hypothetical protein DHS20C16_12850 [Phycisphaerae bacterium]|nr:MAG: hypothetical protein DHS20C16_12850 [Phycisphaerae bacterium]